MACQIVQEGRVIMCKIRHARNDVIPRYASIYAMLSFVCRICVSYNQ